MTGDRPERDRGIGPAPGASPRPLYVQMVRGLWKPFVIGYGLWIPALCILLYVRIVGGMPTRWYVPLLIGLILIAVIPGSVGIPIWAARVQGRVKRAGGRICPNCLYDLRMLDDAAVCPECGWDIVAEAPEVTWARLLNRGKPLAPAKGERPDADRAG
ncbi:MAG: hypothetical protein DHS20C14_18790 [Phycisphaeraceae bacterium]|nr:MAG: hypothetical protein DHS20C14_18790 [Phycisphaeraceae bacterium]